jgi:uncharacterized protein (TIGR04255 family)
MKMPKKYSKPFLKEVIVRLDYSSPIVQLAKTLTQPFKEIIMPLFPISEPKEFIGRGLVITDQSTKEKTIVGTSWIFHGLDRQKTLTLSADNINIIYKTYDSFEMLKSEFLPIIEKLFSTYEDFQGIRLGLRYVDEINIQEGPVFDWSKYIDGRLLNNLTFPEDQSKICRAFSNLELNYGDLIVKFQYGMFNSDYPAPIRKKAFILDYDAYFHGPQDLEEIKSNLEKFHAKIKEMYERSISDELRKLMGVVEDG